MEERLGISVRQQIVFTKTELRSRKKTTAKVGPYLKQLQSVLGPYDQDEILRHIISEIRLALISGGSEILGQVRTKARSRYIMDINRVKEWIQNRLVPNTVIVTLDQEELLRLLAFSLAMPYKMFAGETRATITELVRRTKGRDFQQIFSDHFIGRIGEVAFKQFAYEKFRRDIVLDWRIGKELQAFQSDIVSSKRKVSIRSTDTLESIWADAPPTADYGVSVKVSVAKDFFMKILAHISSLRKLLEYIRQRVDVKEDSALSELLDYIEKEAFRSGFSAKAFICGFFRTSDFNVVKKGEELAFLGEVEQDKYFVPYSRLSYQFDDWNKFFLECGV